MPDAFRLYETRHYAMLSDADPRWVRRQGDRLERARTEFMRSMGYGKTAIFDDDAMFVVHSSNVRYLNSATLDDELVATARPIKVSRAAIVFEQLVKRDDVLLCRGEVKIACVSRTAMAPQAMPDVMYDKVKSLTESFE